MGISTGCDIGDSLPDGQVKMSWNFRAFCVVMLLISSIGPYVAINLRVDHMCLLVSFFVLLFKICAKRVFLSRIWAKVMFAAFLAALIPIVGDAVLSPLTRVTSYFGVVWRLIAPVLLFFVFGISAGYCSCLYDRIVEYVWMLGVFNVVVAIIVFLCSPGWVAFYATGGGGESVWQNAVDVGRFTGVFGQPLEVGIFYSIILLNMVYLWCVRRISLLIFSLSCIMCFVGGALSLSKNFLVLGIALAVGLGIVVNRKRGMMFLLALSLLALFSVVNFTYWVNDSMADGYRMLLDGGGVLFALTAGRFGGVETDVVGLFKGVFVDGLLFGKGMGTYMPLDNGYLEYFYQGGLGALISYLVVHLLFAVEAWRFRRTRAGVMLIFLVVYSLLAALGGPVFTANRVNILLVFLYAYYLALARSEAAERPVKCFFIATEQVV